MEHVLHRATPDLETFPACMTRPGAESPTAEPSAATKNPMLNIRARAASLYMRNGQRNAVECANKNVVLDEHNRVVPTGIMKSLQQRLNERHFQTSGVLTINTPATIPIAKSTNIIRKRTPRKKKNSDVAQTSSRQNLVPDDSKKDTHQNQPLLSALDLALGLEDYM